MIVTDLDAGDSPDAAAALSEITGSAYIRLDATEESEWQAARDRVERDHGRLDILVNNVGADLTGKVQDLELAAWRRLMARVHPDQGGAEGLAAKLNAARDRLLKR